MFYSVFSADVGSFFQNDFLGVIINKLQSNQTNLGVALFSRSSPGLMKNHFLQQILMMKTVVYQASLAPTSMFLMLRVPGTFRGTFHISGFFCWIIKPDVDSSVGGKRLHAGGLGGSRSSPVRC